MCVFVCIRLIISTRIELGQFNLKDLNIDYCCSIQKMRGLGLNIPLHHVLID